MIEMDPLWLVICVGLKEIISVMLPWIFSETPLIFKYICIYKTITLSVFIQNLKIYKW